MNLFSLKRKKIKSVGFYEFGGVTSSDCIEVWICFLNIRIKKAAFYRIDYKGKIKRIY